MSTSRTKLVIDHLIQDIEFMRRKNLKKFFADIKPTRQESKLILARETKNLEKMMLTYLVQM